MFSGHCTTVIPHGENMHRAVLDASMAINLRQCVTSSMSPELETLDQLLGTDLRLEIVLRLYPDATAFKLGVLGLITDGDACLLTIDDIEVPPWRRRELFVDGAVIQEMDRMKLRITPQGIRRIT